MRGAPRFLCLLGILFLATTSCHGLCTLENGTMARCQYLEDAKYIDTYDLEILKTSVSGHRLRSEIFHNLRSLRHLDLTNGELEYVDPGTFRNLIELHQLDLSHNHIAGLVSTSFEGLKKLRSLNLRRNEFKNIPNAVLRVKSLKFLDLTGNPLICNCANLKVRDDLLSRGVHLSKRALCASPENLKAKPLLEPEANVICMFEEQDKEMQMDQPAVEGSGEEPDAADPFDDLISDEFDEETQEESVTSATEEIETPAPTKVFKEEETTLGGTEMSSPIPSVTEVPLSVSTSSDDEIFFSEEHRSTSTVSSTESTDETEQVHEEVDRKSLLRQGEAKEEFGVVEGSGDEADVLEGSGIEGSGTGVPPISWDVPDDETEMESSSSQPTRTTDAGLLDIIWGALWSTSSGPEEDEKKDLGLEEEEFINVSTEPTPASSQKPPVDEEVVVPFIVSGSGSVPVKPNEDAVAVGRNFDGSKSGKVKVEDATDAEATDASATRQPKKGMGSYVVLAALLAVLGVLIGFAAYKGDFCRKNRKQNDPEGGTELRDMRKSLLEPTNGNQLKIVSVGNSENFPLISSSSPQNDSKSPENGCEPHAADETGTRYSAIPDVIDPVKPPRKSFIAQDEPEKILTNGRSQNDLTSSSAPVPEIIEPVCLRNKSPGQSAVNGKNHHDSISSLGTESRDSPSVRTSPRDSSPTNGSLGTLHGLNRPPLSPGAQRVKITLQENPDSVPKTPILITRTKAGENLVKTP